MAKGDHVLLRRIVRDAADYEASSAVAALRSLAGASTHSVVAVPQPPAARRPTSAA